MAARKAKTKADPFLVAKNAEVRRIAEARGLIRKGEKRRTVTARMTEELLAAAKQQTGIESESELLEVAVASLAVGADFGEWLVSQSGRLDKDFKIER